MALQDVVGFRHAPLRAHGHSPGLLSSALEGHAFHFQGVDARQLNHGRPESLPPSQLPFSQSHGTTTLAFVFQGGVIAAADTRSSCAGLVACPASQKILPVHSHLVVTTSGSSADCTLWRRILARECRLYQLRHGRRLSVGGAAKLLSHMLHPFKGTDVCVALILCGWDGQPAAAAGVAESHAWREAAAPVEELCGKTEATRREMQEFDQGEERKSSAGEGESGAGVGPATSCSSSSAESQHWRGPEGSGGQGCGPRLYYVCSDGALLQGALFSVGSGSPYAYSVLDSGLQWAMSLREACSLAREAVYGATHRDAYSGNCVDLFHITARGWRQRRREDLKEEYYREKERKSHGK